jgi:glycosyltransferase involved in cell wall biosynthesis
MLSNYDIVAFGPSDWWAHNPSCATHIMQRLSETNRIIYINPISSDLLAVRTRKRLLTRIDRKFKSILKFVRRANNNLYVLSPLFLPFQGNPALDWVNNTLLKFQLKILMSFLGIKRPLLWIENVRAADFIESFNWQLVLYHISDLFTECPYTHNKEKLELREKKTSKASDILICVSKELYASKHSQRDNVFYIPHGVDFELFREAAQKEEKIEELVSVPKPIAGYFGTMTAYNDIELLLWCARNLPDVSFVFAGEITGGDYSELGKLNNVYLLGRMQYEKIPQLCACFDVCMLQWKMNRWIECCNPLKMFEYMASGKPIVSVPIKEAMRYSDIISIAHDKEQFAKAIRWELQNDTSERTRKRIEIAKNHSWDKHVEKISELIETAITTKQNGRFYLASQSFGEIS